MKKIVYKAVFVACLIGLTACEKTFDELASDPNQQDVNGFYSSPEKIDQGVIGIYAYITTPRAMGTAGRLQINRGDESSDRSDYGAPGQYSNYQDRKSVV